MENKTEAGRTQATWKRSTIMVKKGLQYKYMAMIVLSVLAGFLIVGLEVGLNLWTMLHKHPGVVQPLMDDIVAMVPLALLKMAIYLVIVVIVSMVISHRMAGPLFKFEKSAGTVAGGDLTHRVFLRKGDHLVELQDEFNKMMVSIHSKVKDDRLAAQHAASKLRELAAKTQDPALRDELEKTAEEISKITAGFIV
jgi:methyl-accepting chemotaxis protein